MVNVENETGKITHRIEHTKHAEWESSNNVLMTLLIKWILGDQFTNRKSDEEEAKNKLQV